MMRKKCFRSGRLTYDTNINSCYNICFPGEFRGERVITEEIMGDVRGVRLRHILHPCRQRGAVLQGVGKQSNNQTTDTKWESHKRTWASSLLNGSFNYSCMFAEAQRSNVKTYSYCLSAIVQEEQEGWGSALHFFS